MSDQEKLFSSDQVILVTGASAGIGKAMAHACNAAGATVLACGRDLERLENAKAEAAFPDVWINLQYDLLQAIEALPDWVRSLASQYGKLWGIAHAAGAELLDSLRSYDLENARKHFDLNFHVPILLANGFCDRRASQKGGGIVFVASASAVFPEKGHLAYGAAKAALVAASKSISQEVARLGLRVNCISPGIVDTGMQARTEKLFGPEYRQEQLQGYPLGFGQPDDVAQMAVFLLSGKARWITGQNYVMAGGRY